MVPTLLDSPNSGADTNTHFLSLSERENPAVLSPHPLGSVLPLQPQREHLQLHPQRPRAPRRARGHRELEWQEQLEWAAPRRAENPPLAHLQGAPGHHQPVQHREPALRHLSARRCGGAGVRRGGGLHRRRQLLVPHALRKDWWVKSIGFLYPCRDVLCILLLVTDSIPRDRQWLILTVLCTRFSASFL